MKARKGKHKEILQFDFDFEFKLFAISTTLREYQLSYQIQKAFFLKLICEEDIIVNYPKKNMIANFSRYSCKVELLQREYHLLANKYKGNIFIPELKFADYLFMVKGDCDGEEDDFMKQLKGIAEVQAVKSVEVVDLKSKENLIFD